MRTKVAWIQILKTATLVLLALLLVQSASAGAQGLPPVSTVLQNAQTGNANGVVFSTKGYSTIGLIIKPASSWNGTVNFEASVADSVFTAIYCTNVATNALVTTYASSTTNAQFSCPVSGMSTFRARTSSTTTGNVTVKTLAVLAGGKGGSGGVTVAELDGSPSVPAWKVLVNNDALTDNGDGTATLNLTPGTGGDVSSNTSTSVDGEAVLFSGTGGKTVKRSTLTGLIKETSGVPSAASAGTDYVVPSGNVATATALAANGGNCSAGQFPLGVDASGASESCTALPTTISGTTNQIAASAATGAITLSIPTNPILPGTTTGTFTGNLTGTASLATALAANGTNCSAGQAAAGVDASGNAEGCFTPTGGGAPAWGDITGTLSAQTDLQSALDAKQDTITWGAGLTNSGATASVASTEAGFLTDGATTDLTCGSSNQGKMQVMDSGELQYCDGATTSILHKGVPTQTALTWNVTTGTCTGDSNGGKLTINGSSQIICAGDTGGGGGTAFSSLTSATNTTAAMVVGTGASLAVSGSGTIAATTATALAANGSNCSAGQFPLGVDASGASESCTALPTTISGTANQIAASASTGAITLSIPTNPTLPGTTTGTFSGNITGNVTGNASTATALAADPTDCSAGQYATTIAASGNLTCAAVTDAQLSTSDITTNNVSTTKHGFAPKLSNDANTFLNGTGTYTTPSGSGTITSVWGDSSGDIPNLIAGSGNNFNAAGADASIPDTQSVGLPSTCAEGQQHQVTDSGGSETYKCTATDTWTKYEAVARVNTYTNVDHTIDATDVSNLLYFSTGNTDRTATLPAATACASNCRHYFIEKIDTGTGLVILAPNGTDTLNGVNASISAVASQYAGYDVQETGGGTWRVDTVSGQIFIKNAQNSTYQFTLADFLSFKTITVDSGTFTGTLVGTATQPPDGTWVKVVNYGSGVVTIARSGQNINGGTTSLTLNAGSATDPSFAFIMSDGTNYFAAVQQSASSIGGAPTNAHYVTTQAETGLSAESSLGSLSTGILRQSVSGSVATLASSELSGDVTTSGSNAVTVSKINGTSFAGTNGDLVSFGASNVPADSSVVAANVVTAASNYTNGHLVQAAGANKTTSDSGLTTTTVLTDSSTHTLTNKTLDVEGTGNSITTVSKIWLPSATCQNATASINGDTPTSNAAVAACVTGTNTQKGVADFADSSNLSYQDQVALPSDWSGAIDVKFKWFTSATSGSVVWQIATICVADAETDDPAFNTASTVTDAAKGTTNQLNDATITGVTTTGCAAGELMHIKIFRDSAHASDNLAATARLIGVELTLRRTQ